MQTVDKVGVTLILVLAALCAVLWVRTPEAEISPLIQKAVELGYLPCGQEDSVGPCYWDAQQRGNGEGRSFVVTDDNEVFYE